MRIDIVTIHPKLLKSPFEHSILQRAIDKKIVEIRLHDIRTYSTDKHKKVDDYHFYKSMSINFIHYTNA